MAQRYVLVGMCRCLWGEGRQPLWGLPPRALGAAQRIVGSGGLWPPPPTLSEVRCRLCILCDVKSAPSPPKNRFYPYLYRVTIKQKRP